MPQVGEFVRCSVPPYSDWGVGKLVATENDRAVVQFFDSPGAKLPDLVKFDERHLLNARLPVQTRVYMKAVGSRWQVGRVLEDDRSVIFVQFPNNETINVPVEQLQVRWNKPLQDPLTLLASETTETPFLADARALFVSAVSRQYQAANGSSALLCSSIDLVDYQFDVIRRVLLDPVQRYLLADEVGLGKTIEASVILRQYFIDDASATAVVIVPSALVGQWRKELVSRFSMDLYLDDTLSVIAHDDLKGLAAVIGGAGMLIIDEAHHLSKQATAIQRDLYELVRTHSRRVHRLLLLSATPVLGNAEEFLRVLHLLDPIVFPIDDLVGFKKRIQSRQVVAEVVSVLLPENVWGLAPDLDRLLENYSDDSLLVEKVEVLKKILDTFPNEEDVEFLRLLDDLRTHLVESYRLHRRILRNRRISVSWATPRRSEMRPVRFSGIATREWYERLENLRLALGACDEAPDTVCQGLFQMAVQPSSMRFLHSMLVETSLFKSDILEQAKAVERAFTKMQEENQRITAMSLQILQTLKSNGVQVVVFCDLELDANRVFSELKKSIGEQHVVRHSSQNVGEYEDDAPAEWEVFLTDPDLARVLVCDSRAEEGVNLHGGRKVAYHYDLPASPNRIEQRLGRLDRYGTGDPIISYVMLDECNPNEVAWAEVLNNGWGVFKQSVASLQYLIESVSVSLARNWFEQGVAILLSHALELGGENGLVQHEIVQLNHQDSLDALANREIDGMEQLDDADLKWSEWRDAFKGFAVGTLAFNWRGERDGRVQLNVDEPFRLGYSHRDGGNRQTLLPLTGFLTHFLTTVDHNAVGGGSRLPLSRRYAFKRQTVASRSGLARQLHLLRVGDPFVTALEHFCKTDDRGRCFAVWRVDRQYEVSDPSGADLYFRFDFVVRPSQVNESERNSSLKDDGVSRIKTTVANRKVSTFFAPLAIRVWVNASGAIDSDPSDFLRARYSDAWINSRRDFNLSVSRWRGLPGSVKSSWMKEWPQLCSNMKELAVSNLKNLEVYSEHIQSALQACRFESRLHRSQGEVRVSRLTGIAREHELLELQNAKEFYISLEDAISNPLLELDVVGAIFLASDTPFES